MSDAPLLPDDVRLAVELVESYLISKGAKVGYSRSLEFRFIDAQPCATCQCARIHGTAPMPDNPSSKSWHE